MFSGVTVDHVDGAEAGLGAFTPETGEFYSQKTISPKSDNYMKENSSNSHNTSKKRSYSIAHRNSPTTVVTCKNRDSVECNKNEIQEPGKTEWGFYVPFH